jgi:hypothetical protein
MIQRGDGSCFLLKPSQSIEISGEGFLQNFQRDVAEQTGVVAR